MGTLFGIYKNEFKYNIPVYASQDVTNDGKHLLQSVPVGTIFPDHMSSIISVNKSDSVATAFELLTQNKILSMPLYDPLKRSFVCFIDIVDIVTFAVDQFKEENSMEQNFNSFMDSLKHTTCGSIANISNRDAYRPVEATAPLLSVFKLMTGWYLHRIPAVDAEGSLVTILTQSHVLNYLYKYMHKFSGIASQTIESLGMMHEGVISVGLQDSTLDAFKLMRSKMISAVAVVDQTGKLAGNISVTDLQLIGYDGNMISRIYYPVSQFLKLVPKSASSALEHYQIKENENGRCAVCVKKTATYSEVLNKLVNKSIHRVYVVDDEHKPIGVISHHEVIHCLLKHVGL